MAMSLRLSPACGLGQGSPELQAPAHPMTYREPPTPSSPAWPQGWHPAHCLVFKYFEHCPQSGSVTLGPAQSAHKRRAQRSFAL